MICFSLHNADTSLTSSPHASRKMLGSVERLDGHNSEQGETSRATITTGISQACSTIDMAQ